MKRDRGFTLIELMVVIAILGITAGVVITNFRSNPTGRDARHLAAAMSTAFRTAMQGGPVRNTIQKKDGITARAQLEIKKSGDRYQVTVYKLVEEAEPSTTWSWVAVESFYLNQEVEILSVASSAQLSPSATEITSGGLPAEKMYYPSGSADGFTAYLRHKYQSGADRYRVVGMPLSPAPQVFQDW